MSQKTAPTITLALCLAVAVIAWSPSYAATAVAESDSRVICIDSGRVSLPRKITIMQVIDDPFYESALVVHALLFSSYPFRFDVDSGKVIAKGLLIKADGSEIPLPKLAARMRDGDADKDKPTDAVFEVGDLIEWAVKVKGLAPLEGVDCWSLEVGILGGDAGAVQKSLLTLTGMTKRIK